jgi:hypothetical protein
LLQRQRSMQLRRGWLAEALTASTIMNVPRMQLPAQGLGRASTTANCCALAASAPPRLVANCAACAGETQDFPPKAPPSRRRCHPCRVWGMLAAVVVAGVLLGVSLVARTGGRVGWGVCVAWATRD